MSSGPSSAEVSSVVMQPAAADSQHHHLVADRSGDDAAAPSPAPRQQQRNSDPSTSHGRFHDHAADLDRKLQATLEENARRRATLIDNLGHGYGSAGVMGKAADVSPLIAGGYGARVTSNGYGGGHAGTDPYLQQQPHHPQQHHQHQHQHHHQQQHQLPPYGGGGSLFRGGSPASTPAALLTTTDAVERQVRAAVSREMQRQEERVVELIAREWDRRSQELEHALRGRFTDLQVLHESTTRLLREVGGSVSSLKAEVKAEMDRIDVSIANLTSETRTKMQDQGRVLSRDVGAVRELALEVQSRFQVDTAEYSRRVESMQRRASESYAEAMGAVESKVKQLKSESESSLRDLRRALQGDVDEAVRSAADSRAIVGRGDEELRRVTGKISDLLEDAATRRSEIRTLREDARQMELYVKGRIDRVAASAARTNAAATVGSPVGTATAARVDGHGHRHDHLVNVAEITRLQNDMYTMKQGVAFLHGRMRAAGLIDDEGEDIDRLGSRHESQLMADGALPEPLHHAGEPSGANFVLSEMTVQGGDDSRSRHHSHSTQQHHQQHSGRASPGAARVQRKDRDMEMSANTAPPLSRSNTGVPPDAAGGGEEAPLPARRGGVRVDLDASESVNSDGSPHESPARAAFRRATGMSSHDNLEQYNQFLGSSVDIGFTSAEPSPMISAQSTNRHSSGATAAAKARMNRIRGLGGGADDDDGDAGPDLGAARGPLGESDIYGSKSFLSHDPFAASRRTAPRSSRGESSNSGPGAGDTTQSSNDTVDTNRHLANSGID